MTDLMCAAGTISAIDRHRIEQLARRYAQAEPEFAAWAAGYGVIQHTPLTQLRVRAMLAELVAAGAIPDSPPLWRSRGTEGIRVSRRGDECRAQPAVVRESPSRCGSTRAVQRRVRAALRVPR